MKHIFKEAEKLILPLLLFLAGIAAVWFYNKEGAIGRAQPLDMLLGGLALIFSGILMVLIFFRLVSSRIINIILSVVLGIVAVVFCYRVFDVIFAEKHHRKTRDDCTEMTIQNLKDLRFCQEKYAEYNGGVYTEDLDKLFKFLEKDIIAVPYRNGNVLEDKEFLKPGNEAMKKNRDKYIIHRKDLGTDKCEFKTEEEARAAHYEIRDTSYVSHIEKYFSNDYREKKNLPLITNIEDIKKNPCANKPFIVEYKYERNYDSTKLKRPREVYLLISDPAPFKIDQNDLVKKDTLRFGDPDLKSPILDGNWSK